MSTENNAFENDFERNENENREIVDERSEAASGNYGNSENSETVETAETENVSESETETSKTEGKTAEISFRSENGKTQTTGWQYVPPKKKKGKCGSRPPKKID